MKTKILIITLIAFLPLVATCQPFAPTFTSNDWLNDHLGEEDLVIFHVGDNDNYSLGHILGAQFINLSEYKIYE